MRGRGGIREEKAALLCKRIYADLYYSIRELSFWTVARIVNDLRFEFAARKKSCVHCNSFICDQNPLAYALFEDTFVIDHFNESIRSMLVVKI